MLQFRFKDPVLNAPITLITRNKKLLDINGIYFYYSLSTNYIEM